MSDSPREVARARIRAARVSAVTLAAFLPLAVGCTSNEYVIPHDELARLAATPPAQRGARVRVVQGLGERRSDPVPTTPEPSPVAAGDEQQDDSGESVRLDISGDGRSAGAHQASAGHAAGRPPATGWRPAAPHPAGGGGSGVHLGGGGGGGGNGDAVLVVIVVAVAVVVAVGLVSSEGVRFDGYVALAPEQPLHLRDARGAETIVPVAELSGDEAAGTVEAKVMDDEAYGVLRLDRAPLDRRGGVFKLDSGTVTFDVAGAPAVGPAMNVQAGYFFTRRIGLLANINLAGVGVPQGLVPRHALGLELQAFPLAFGPVHLGLFGDGGMALTKVLAGGGPTYVSGPSVGGGALAELDLTSRLALTLRAGADLSRLEQTWTPAGQLTAGVAVY